MEDIFDQENPSIAAITVTVVEIKQLSADEQTFFEASQALIELRDRRLYWESLAWRVHHESTASEILGLAS